MKYLYIALVLSVLFGCARKPNPEEVATKAIDLLFSGKAKEAAEYFHPDFIKKNEEIFTKPIELSEEEKDVMRPEILNTTIEDDVAKISMKTTEPNGHVDIQTVELRFTGGKWVIFSVTE